MIKHIDLFSGIGGFAYAAQQVWGKQYQNILFCENNKFCQEVLKKNFGKDSVIYEDIREVTANAHFGRQEKQEQQATRDKRCNRRIDLLTGGFPCQPFSCAGQRRGTEDNRYLWPEMFRVIKDFKPRWVIAENVRGLINIQNGVVFEQVCLDLENEGYEVQPFIIPAVAVNAPHRRDRVWIVANRNDTRSRTPGSEVDRNGSSKDQGREEQSFNVVGGQVASDTRCEYGTWTEKPRKLTRQVCSKKNAPMLERPVGDAPDTKTKRLEKPGFEPREQASSSKFRDKFYDWETNWLEVATELCRVDDGLPTRLDFTYPLTLKDFKLTKAGHRVERLKALGNAIVPQVVTEIMRAIKYADENGD